MSGQGKKILMTGVGAAINKSPEAVKVFGDVDTIQRAAEKETQALEAIGYECTAFPMDTDNWSESLERLREMLQSQQWAGFTIGGGFRTIPQFRVMFEEIVNLSREVAPSTKIGFPSGPDNIFETVKRLFPDAQ